MHLALINVYSLFTTVSNVLHLASIVNNIIIFSKIMAIPTRHRGQTSPPFNIVGSIHKNLSRAYPYHPSSRKIYQDQKLKLAHRTP